MSFICHKRTRSLNSKNAITPVNKIWFKKNSHISPDNRIITFKNVNGKNISIKINSKNQLKKKLIEFNFKTPYYILDGKEIVIDNFRNFFHFTSIKEIYNFEYNNLIDKNQFELQYKSIPNYLKDENLFLDKFFLFNSDYYKQHLPNYNYICFIKSDINLCNLRSFASYSENLLNVIEIFGKNKIGITTELYVYYSQLRTKLRTNERFILFFIFDFGKLLKLKKLNSLMNILNFNLINLFVDYEKYNQFCELIIPKIKKSGFNIVEIILIIMKEFVNHIKNEDMLYLPVFIIDNYSPQIDQNKNLYNDLIKLQ